MVSVRHPADVRARFCQESLIALPDLFLAGMVGADGEGHQHLQRHAILGIDVEQHRRDGSEAQALLHDLTW